MAQTSGPTVMVVGSKDQPRITRQHNRQDIDVSVPEPLPFKYIVVGSSINPGPNRIFYDTDTFLTEADVQRMTTQENLKVVKDKVPWAW